MILIAYDGSPDAQAAIERAGELFGTEPATILTVWQRFIDVVTRFGAGLSAGDVDYEALDRVYEQEAREQAEDGVARARQAGLEAQPRVRVRQGAIAATIIAEADDIGASAIVLGTRGLTGLKSVFLGSVSHAITQQSHLPVMVVPSPETASGRAAQQA